MDRRHTVAIMDGPSLRTDVFLLAHDDAGRLVGSEASIGAGLAGATLIELLLAGRVAVADGRLDVIDSAVTGDEETDATLEAIAANTAPCGPRAWVSWISHGAYDRVAEGLAEAGVVRPDHRPPARPGAGRSGSGRPSPTTWSGSGPGCGTRCTAGTCPTRRPPPCAGWSGCCGWSRRCC